MKYLCVSFPIKVLISILCLVYSFTLPAKTIALLGQWHLLASQNTKDIKASQKLVQYPNQKALYLILKQWILEKKIDVLLAEGCEAQEINQNFSEIFNGWGYAELEKYRESKDFSDIIGFLPLKIEVEFKNDILTLCADSKELIKEHQLIFSDISSYTGFFVRLSEHKNNPKVFDAYAGTLSQIAKKDVKDPINYSRMKALELIEKERNLIEKRNEHFLNVIKNLKQEKVALVIGQRHVKHLKKTLEKLGHTVVTPEIIDQTLKKEDLISQFKDLLMTSKLPKK